MSSGENSDTNDVKSERETQFVDQSGDEDVLWAVQEITAERGNKYRVKWAGVDPATGKPWPQSWVPKYDCTNDLAAEWKAKKRLAAGKKRGVGRQTSTTSRTSGTSKRASSSTLGMKTRRSTSRAASSRLDSGEQDVSLPPKHTTTKRERQSETSATVLNGAVQANEQSESPRPRKKLKTIVEVLLPPISSDEGEDDQLVPDTRAKVTPQNTVPSKRNGTSPNATTGGDNALPKAKAKSERRSDTRSESTAVGSKVSDARVPRSKAETKVAPRRKEHVNNTDVLSAESEDRDEERRPPKSKKKLPPKRRAPLEQNDSSSEKEVESAVYPIKVGPRGVRRQGVLRESGPHGKLQPSRASPPENNLAHEDVRPEESGHEALSFGSPVLLQQNMADNHTSPPCHISLPQVPPSAPPRSPDLSPGTKARLELFDRMMADLSQPDATSYSPYASKDVPDDTHFNSNDAYGVFDPPPPLSPPLSKSKPKHPKLPMPNGLVVPETESSSNSQSSHLLLKPPSPEPPLARNQSPRKPIDLPTIAVIAASATSSSASPQDLLSPQKLLPSVDRPSKRPTFKITSTAFNANSRVTDSEPPPSSIESFTSPQRVDKGKQRAVEDDQLQGSLSEGVEGGKRRKTRTRRNITDSELKKRGKELFNQAQRTREVEWRRNKKAKRLKTVNEIVNGKASSPSKGSSHPFTSDIENTLEMQREGVVDLSSGANSTTLDTLEHCEPKPLSEEQRERMRIELRQEEEENTQEAMGVYLPPCAEESEVMNCDSGQSLTATSHKNFLFNGTEDIDQVEQPSTDLHQASVIVQASQGQRHEDTDIISFPANQSTSSPCRPIPENLTDSPRRRLGEALSLLNVKSEEIQRLERELADERKSRQGLEVQLAEIQQSSEPTGPVRAAWEAERIQWNQERSKWENDVSVWETQRKEMSEGNANLSVHAAELSDAAVRAEEVRTKLSELEAERVAWIKERDIMLNDIAQRSEELNVLTKVRGEYGQDQLKWEVERILWDGEKARWETERSAHQEKQDSSLRSIDELSASAESMRAAKVSAEKDRDFFREQYMQASGFVSSVRDENVELEKRVKIAEEQAQEGVAAIKALFEGRVKALQADVDRWKGLSKLLQEKDTRTNDELRLRAARVPELEELCHRLDTENESLEVNVRKLSQAQQRGVHQRNKLFYEILMLKKERACLRSKLSKFTKTTDNGTQNTSHLALAPSTLEDPESMDPNDMVILPDSTSQQPDSFDEPALFPCLWRPQWRDQCQQIFDTKEDLERHMQGHFRDLLIQ